MRERSTKHETRAHGGAKSRAARLFARLPLVLALFAAAAPLFAQEVYPDEIRGYKVHRAKIAVTNRDAPGAAGDDAEAFARVSDPELVETALTGLTFELSAAIDPLAYKGRVDFLTFRDFKVNGLAVEIEEYRESFEFKKNEPIRLPRPVRVFLGAGQALRGALGELRGAKDEWTVTGTVFVFGRFKKWGFGVKRVVPVPVAVTIKNPLREGGVLPVKIPPL